MNNKWRQRHKTVIVDLLNFINSNSENYILKGGTALMTCYDLDRFSEDIDFDSLDKQSIKELIDKFVKKNNYTYRVAKDTDLVKRFMINYGNNKPLKVEISYRKKIIDKSRYTTINNLKVYKIDELAAMKSAAYIGRDRIRDLYDMAFICNNYWEDISDGVKTAIRNNIEYKGIEQFDYIVNTQKDELIDNDKLAQDFLEMYDKLDLLNTKKTMDTDARKPLKKWKEQIDTNKIDNKKELKTKDIER